MKVLIFDTETSGLPLNIKIAPNFDNVFDWPSIVQLSFVVYDTTNHTVCQIADDIISLPAHTPLSVESVAIHGITRERIANEGQELSKVLDVFFAAVAGVDVVVAHNVQFDKSMLEVELLRIIDDTGSERAVKQMEILQKNVSWYCTMKKSVTVCNILVTNNRGGQYAKFPTLLELHLHLFHIAPKNLHNSLNDVVVCLRCYLKMVQNDDIMETEHGELNDILSSLL